MSKDNWPPASPLMVLGVLPSGTIGIIGIPRGGLPSAKGLASEVSLSEELQQAFQRGPADGLTLLSSVHWEKGLTPATAFWRKFGRLYFQSICRQSTQSSDAWNSPDAPSEETLSEILQTAPMMVGLENLRPESLAELWVQLDQYTQQKVRSWRKGANASKLSSYLHSLDPAWNLIGRVTFHLAENKKSETKPFAFIATYTESASKSGAFQHVPLAEALKQSLDSGDTRRLDALLQPVSRAADECEIVSGLLESRALFSAQAWSISQAFKFLTSVPLMEKAGVIVRVPNWWNASRPPRPQVTVRVGNRPTASMGAAEALDFNVGVAIDGEPLDAEELGKLMEARSGLALLRGKWVQIDQQQLRSALDHWKSLEKQHAGGMGFLEGMRLLSGATMPGEEQGNDDITAWTRIQPGDWLEEMLLTLRDPSGNVALAAPKKLKATLRPYQLDGFRWLWFANQLGLGVCLADDMGLGKTIQVIALLLELKFPSGKKPRTKTTKRQQPSLLVVPTSLLGNWMREVQRFAPDLKLFVAHRSITSAAELKRVAESPVKELASYDLVMTTYGLARRVKWVHQCDWRLVILDEAQAIKNAGATQTQTIKKIPAKSRIVMTGTPVENHLGDIWSLFDFCSPGLLGTATEFKKFVKASQENARDGGLASLRRLIQPYVMRRLKTDPDIAPELPDKTELRVECGLTATQAALYQQTLDDLEDVLENATGLQRSGVVLGTLMQLKQICNHASLYLKHPDFELSGSGKFAELKSIVATLSEKQEKMLVFTQFQSMCDPLREFLSHQFGRDGLVLSGKTASAKRTKLVSEFQQESGPPFFVISVKAGGTGLNLTQACHVVHFDRWWNPAIEDQATDRAFRIGQKRNVMVHKFVCRGTLEEKIDDLIHSKKKISQDLFAESGEVNLTEMSNDQLMGFVSLDLNKATTK